jgi:hypothetical protein
MPASSTASLSRSTGAGSRPSKFDAQFAGRLDGQTVLVTGTTKGGIGHETLLRKGADDFASPSRVVNMTALIESRG